MKTHIFTPQTDLLTPSKITKTGNPADTVKTVQESPDVQEKGESEDQAPAPAASWWNYVGWSSAVLGPSNVPSASSTPPILSATPSEAEKQDDEEPPKSASTVYSEQDLSPVSPPLPDMHATLTPRSAPDLKRMAESQATIKPARNQAMSVRSAETGAVRSNASWLAPWTWYSAAPAVSEPAGVAEEQPPKGGETHTDGEGRTDAERIRDAALADRAASPVPPAPSTPSATTPLVKTPEEENPVAKTVASSKQGWAAFFAQRAMAGRLLGGGGQGEEKKEGEQVEGMEVMDVPDDEELNAVREVVIGSPLDNERAKSPPPPQGKPKGGGPPGEREPRKQGPPDLPLTDSQSVKRAAANRNASPAPSRSSGKATPPASARKTPNLVLPTWGDTFHAPPRNVPPPRPKEMQSGGTARKVKGALKYMSGVLGSLAGEEEGTGKDSKGKGKARAKPKVPFGMGLPKAWDIAEPQADGGRGTDVLRGAKNAVVIGVHGWFPGMSSPFMCSPHIWLREG